MKKYKAIIIDDEQGSIDSLLWELETFDQVEVIATSTDSIKGIDLIQANDFDILFLDIEMPKVNGFELLKSIENIDFKVIFTTAYDAYALKAFEVSAIDYLLKPVEEGDLGRALDKLNINTQEDETIDKLASLYEKLSSLSQTKNISLPTQEGLSFINIQTIIRCESDSNYTHIYLKEDKPLLVSKTLKDIEKLIDSKEFFRIHHSHLINLNYLKKYNKGLAGSVELSDGSIIPVSRSKKSSFLNKF